MLDKQFKYEKFIEPAKYMTMKMDKIIRVSLKKLQLYVRYFPKRIPKLITVN